MAFKKSIISVNTESVHSALVLKSDKRVLVNSEGFMYHLTHETVDGMMDRHIRYWRGEASGYSSYSLKQPCVSIIKAFGISVLRGSLWKGWAIFALSCAYLAYHLMSFVYIWEKKYGDASNLYSKIRNDLYNQWK